MDVRELIPFPWVGNITRKGSVPESLKYDASPVPVYFSRSMLNTRLFRLVTVL